VVQEVADLDVPLKIKRSFIGEFPMETYISNSHAHPPLLSLAVTSFPSRSLSLPPFCLPSLAISSR